LNNVRNYLDSIDHGIANYGKYMNVITGDYLMAETGKYDVIIGNPPYVRYDNIPIEKIDMYKSLFACFKNRCDLYIAFFEKGIKSLKQNGVLTFVCADRWLNNQYGTMLRKTIYHNFYFSDIIKINGFSPFNEEVIAYPAIFSIRNTDKGKTRYFIAEKIEDLSIDVLNQKANNIEFDTDGYLILTKDNEDYLTIEEQGFKIGIGVATGADKVFVVEKSKINIESDLLVPLITRKDVEGDEITWKDRYVINPFVGDSSRLIDLDNYPLAKTYFGQNINDLMKRHVSRKDNKNWYKTIDRILPGLTTEPKLLLPDISTKNMLIYDEGHFYPHHNFYFIVGNGVKDLLVLQALLSTAFVRKQVTEKGLLMNGGALRWQAQTLRKIKIPNILNMKAEEKDYIIEAYRNKNFDYVEKI
jgi:adenine-specific DNA-methyltransferase